MNYTEAVDYIETIPKFTVKHPPEHTRELLSRLGNPQEGIKIIHVAGTNGKGSVCAYLNAMLLAGGKKTGLFTSPHLVRINERFQINGEDVSDEQFLDAFLKVEKAAKEYEAEGEGHPSYFETLFLMGMLIFKEAGVEYLVMETGLGGRLDATNVVEKPLACIITSISRDHIRVSRRHPRGDCGRESRHHQSRCPGNLRRQPARSGFCHCRKGERDGKPGMADGAVVL